MKCQSPFFWDKYENISLSAAELAQGVVKVNLQPLKVCLFNILPSIVMSFFLVIKQVSQKIS